MELSKLRYHMPSYKDTLDLLILTGEEASLDETKKIEEITDRHYNKSKESGLRCIFPSFRKENKYRKNNLGMKSYEDGKNKRIIKYEKICGSDSPAVIPTKPKKGNEEEEVTYKENLVEFTEMPEKWGKYNIQIHSIMGNKAFDMIKDVRSELNPELSEEVKNNFEVLNNLL
ncbi:MAG: hypothetical protein ABEK36_02110 [Candidatus Aenigmatarchaeota archaeon]